MSTTQDTGQHATTRLHPDTVGDLDPSISVPGYDRSMVRTGIVHLGVGGFHRAHQAMYVDRLLEQGVPGAEEWGITGVGVLPQDARMAEVLSEQQGLYTLVVKHADGSRDRRVVGSLVDYLHAPADPEAVLARMTDPATRIVSLTVTEGGYHVNPVTGDFDDRDPGIQADLRGDAPPVTTFGLLTEALARRRTAGTAPFTVMSCDNIEGNGHVAQRMVTAFATRRDAELGGWIGEHVDFPSCMVDRITPVTTDEDREELRRDTGLVDGWPVVTEDFTQWALEDRFTQGRPAWEEAGVQVVEDVRPYELMKLRLLNASHQALGYLGYLSGYRYAHEVCQDELFAGFLLDYMEREASPTLEPVPGVDLADYRHRLVERFANPEIRDTLARLCAESSDRIPTWLVPVVRDNLAHDGEVRRSALVVAAWARYAEGVDEDGTPIEVVDRRREEVMARAARQQQEPLAFLEDRDLFDDLAGQPRFTEAYTEALTSLHEHGARATLTRWQQD